MRGRSWLPSKPPEFVLLLAYIAALPVMSVLILRLGGRMLAPCDFIFVLVVAASLPSIWRGDFRAGLFEALLLLYLGATLLSTVLSGSSYTGVIKVAYLVAVAAWTRWILRGRVEDAVGAWKVGTAIAVAGGLLGIATFYLGWSSFWNPLLGHYGTVPGGYYPRLTSLFSSPNTLCNYLIVGAALVWYRGSRLFLAGILSVSLFTVSSGLGGLALVMGLSARRIRGAAGLGIILAAVSLAAVLVSPTALMEGSLEPSGRLLTWREALDDWADHPLTGAGPGATTIEVHYQGPAGAMMHWTEAHNIWLSVASQLGLLGLVPLLGLTVWSLRPAVSQMQHLRKALQMALLGSWLIHGLSGAFEDSRHLWVLVGMLAATECDE